VTPTPGAAYQRISDNVQAVVRGKPELVRLAVAALFAEGHLLIEDVPGVGKTTLARCISASIGGKMSRIQFTPDLLPGDITGVMVYHQNNGEFRFHPGGIFANVVLADEINRGTPKTQAALLEVMAERRVTVDSTSHQVPRPFLVVATQNPIELEGTYRLPEAQLDRFLMRVRVGYPDHDAELMVVMSDCAEVSPDDLPAVLSVVDLQQVIKEVRQFRVASEIGSYAVRLAAATRAHQAVRFGASPRGSIALIRAAQGLAATHGRDYVIPDDVKDVAQPVLGHRIVLTPEAELARRQVSQVVAELLREVPAPTAIAGR
jgi:MoxR-like ATPase